VDRFLIRAGRSVRPGLGTAVSNCVPALPDFPQLLRGFSPTWNRNFSVPSKMKADVRPSTLVLLHFLF
jgi:hypothetical protein